MCAVLYNSRSSRASRLTAVKGPLDGVAAPDAAPVTSHHPPPESGMTVPITQRASNCSWKRIFSFETC